MRAARLLRTSLVEAHDVVCDAPRSACGAAEHNAAAEVLVPRRGVFALHRGRAVTVADAGTAVVLGCRDEYRVSHPGGDGDRCVVLRFAPALHEEAFGDLAGRSAPLPFAAALRARRPLAEEDAMLLLADVARSPAVRPSPAARRAADVGALLASDPGRRWRLDAVARAVHCSPFHLARQFHAATGETIARHLVRLRLALALERLREGEDDLARLAADLGFASHSHFSARFRAAFGAPPSQVRKTLTARGAGRA
jgi:AraC family transcriptional regulator